MKIGCASIGILDEYRPHQGLEDLRIAGFNNYLLDLSMYCPGFMLENYEQLYKPKQASELYDRLQKRVKENGWTPFIIRAPRLLLDSKRTDLNQLLLEIGRKCVAEAETLGCTRILIQPLFVGVDNADLWKKNKEYYLELAKCCKCSETMILLENQCKNLHGHLVRGICANPTEALNWIHELNRECEEERFGFCMNVGICGQNTYDVAVTLKEHVKSVIINDGNGQEMLSMLPFTSVSNKLPQTDWMNLIRGLRQIAFNDQLVLDFSDTAAVFSPLIKPELLRMAKAIGDYIAWQIAMEQPLRKYNSIVLFGAGNMCRNFMKCYGDQYRPLFTCDNNPNMWGGEFCGLEVKSPEALKDIPKDCGVFICNVYYREIEAQLKEMGIENIEFFNDEYMPSYYFDRIERK